MVFTFRLLTAIAAWAVALTAVPMATQVASRELPQGEGRETVLTMCSDCHDAERVAEQRRSRLEWQTLVEDMAARNGGGAAEDLETIVRYLAVNFGRVNVNVAPAVDIAEIAGLTSSDATAIAEFRKREGEYRALEDLRKVPGLDFARIQERKDRIVFAGP